MAAWQMIKGTSAHSSGVSPPSVNPSCSPAVAARSDTTPSIDPHRERALPYIAPDVRRHAVRGHDLTVQREQVGRQQDASRRRRTVLRNRRSSVGSVRLHGFVETAGCLRGCGPVARLVLA